MVRVQKSAQLTPRARKMYSVARNLKTYVNTLTAEQCTFKDRLRMAEVFTSSNDFIKLKVVNPISYNFIMSQLKLQQMKTHARRFSLEDKVLALSLMKQSPKAYKLLSRLFDLPSKKTLLNLLRDVPLKAGLSDKINKSLKIAVANMTEMHKTCIIMFDEMSLNASLQYNATTDEIDGFQDFDEDKRKPVFAEHALVFMARGVFKKWKQPVTYYLTGAGVSSAELVVLVKEVTHCLLSVGLNVIGTVCDQLSANSSAYNSLLNETNRFCLLNNKENKYLGFLVDNKEIVPLYDVPHLLKGIRNNLLEHDAEFVQDGKVKRASWSDIISFYEFDTGHEDLKMCYKLTDAHVYKDKIKKMKVKNAAQIFSRSFSAVMRGFAVRGKLYNIFIVYIHHLPM